MSALAKMAPAIPEMPRLNAATSGKPLLGRKVLIVVENLPTPFDRRVWHECRTLFAAGAQVCVICPKGKGYEKSHELLDGIHIYRHSLPVEAKGAAGFLVEYSAALFWQTWLAWKIFVRHGFDTLQGCNPPDLIFLIAWQFKIFGVRYIFDHHDINPELYEAKFGKRGFFWRLMLLFERINFWSANAVISTNNSYAQIARDRGKKMQSDIFVVRSGPDLSRLTVTSSNESLRNGRKFLVGYVGVMGDQEGIDLLLEAARILVKEMHCDVQFCLVGGGPALVPLQSLGEKLDLENHVSFIGRAPDNILFEVLSTADVCVNPDRVNPMNDKSTMNKILEYMAFSKPIVQFDVAEGRYSAQDSSLYARPNDPRDMAEKIAALLADPEKRQAMGILGRQRVESVLSWDHQVDNLIAAYQHAKS